MSRVFRIRTFVFLLLPVVLSACGYFYRSQPPVLRLEAIHDIGATRLAFAPDSRSVATGGYLGEIYVWSVPDGEQRQVLRLHEDVIRSLAWVNPRTLLSADESGVIALWDVPSGHVHARVDSRPGTALATVVFAPRLWRVFAGYDDGTVQAYRLPDFKPLQARTFPRGILSLAVRPDGAQVAVSLWGRHVELMSNTLASGRVLPAPPRDAIELQYAPDGTKLAAGAWFRLLFWDLVSGALTVRATEHQGAVVAIDYSPDGRYLASISRHTDAKVRLMDVAEDRMVRRLEPHALCGFSVRISPDGRYVGSASEDSSVRLYDLRAPYQPR